MSKFEIVLFAIRLRIFQIRRGNCDDVRNLVMPSLPIRGGSFDHASLTAMLASLTQKTGMSKIRDHSQKHEKG